MHARPFGVVGIGTARREIGLVGGQRAIDRDRGGAGVAITAARQFLRLFLRLVEGQHGLAVGIFEVVGECEALGPVVAVAVADLEHPRSVGLVAAVHQSMPRASDGPL